MSNLKSELDQNRNFDYLIMDVDNTDSKNSVQNTKYQDSTKISRCLSSSRSSCFLNRKKLFDSILEYSGDIKKTNYSKFSDISSNKQDLEEKIDKNSFNIRTSPLLENTFWLDPDFLPVKKSLYMNGNKVKRTNLIHSNGFKQIRKWLRPFEINGLQEDNCFNVSLFLDPSPKDVIQGELGISKFYKKIIK
jgi:hypothetical protein